MGIREEQALVGEGVPAPETGASLAKDRDEVQLITGDMMENT